MMSKIVNNQQGRGNDGLMEGKRRFPHQPGSAVCDTTGVGEQ